MAHIHANGDEEQRPRTPEEIAAIEEQNRVAAKACWREGDRRDPEAETIPHNGKAWYQPANGGRLKPCRRKAQRRQVLSTFERDMLLLPDPPEGCAYTMDGKLIRYKKASHEDA